MDSGSLPNSNLLISNTDVLTPVSDVLTISIDKDSSGGTETKPSTAISQLVVTADEPQTKEETVTTMSALGAREELAQLMAGGENVSGNEKATKQYVGQTESVTAPEQPQFVIVRVKASEPTELVRKLVADSIQVPLRKTNIYYRGTQVYIYTVCAVP